MTGTTNAMSARAQLNHQRDERLREESRRRDAARAEGVVRISDGPERQRVVLEEIREGGVSQ